MADGSLWQHAQEIFLEALDKPLEERAAFVAEACGNDAELRAEVESLLEHDSRAGDDFLRPPEPPSGRQEADPPAGPDPLIGGQVGRYHIKSRIAAGGMGMVYLAEQEHPRRDVALKIMKPGVSSRSAARHFEYESEILARLRHPSIAQVYEAGTHEAGWPSAGRVPYFAMEYVPGAMPITEHAGQEKLSTRERLELFIQVCEAVHHGHQRGIIHRDLKPGNILVDSAGLPKVIDFGVARLTDSDVAVTTQRTDAGQIIGTLQYMSPEQCHADPQDLDTRSDVYSLGVVLYELLCGQAPYDLTGSPVPVATRAICEKAPRRPSAISRALRGDLEMIVLKALEKDRERRYQSAAALAQDIRRHLNGEPIEAKPPTAWTRAVRWAIRHPKISTAAVCLVVGVATGVSAAITSQVYLVRYQLNRPSEMQLSENGQQARLLALTGKVLHKWPVEPPGEIRLAELVERPGERDDGPLALIAYNCTQSNPYPGALCAYDVNGDLEVPIWQGRIETEDILPELREERGLVAEEFAFHDGWILDVFPKRPGREIVALFAAGIYSQRVLRIYDLAGAVLYQVWHDGAMGSCYWMSGPGLLVFAGDCQEPYHDRSGQLLGSRVKDVVVFAVCPKAGHINNDDYLPLVPGDDPLSPTFYLRLRPDDMAEIRQSIHLYPPNPPHDPSRQVLCSVILRRSGKPDTSTWWVIDERGEEVEGTRGVDDEYRRNQKLPEGDPERLPEPSLFHLTPMAETGDDSEDASDT
jgi:serine/threonine protein kinase